MAFDLREPGSQTITQPDDPAAAHTRKIATLRRLTAVPASVARPRSRSKNLQRSTSDEEKQRGKTLRHGGGKPRTPQFQDSIMETETIANGIP
ncbi:hypothetical protein Snoj_32460 [Streptomyces nojiriensis]|uniref:Uncharacterized protein n=1 Tax=Streptomyces nojiriensis TaxID=66374 RepID=A0ABQ3SMI0_9ACTN|nr:hypothetical protein GCM10010205_74550 [Streptomyces nojiriensis]GHI69328.1 hypothetical protein Snoj_32460 [Streptomyces nojiriensis]